ncbi:MAG: hypothetical protein L3J52_10375, partial [Proteobacteria bacterium]|nr:hypothetical protein [Pseudomonadota bacterium]
KNDSNKANRQPLNKMDMIVVELQRFKANSGKLSLGRSVLIKKIDKIYGGHIRAKAIITELLANNIVTENNRNYLINESLNKQLSKQSQLADEVDITTRRLFQTFYKKMFSSDSSFDLSQYTLVSGKVPPSQHNNLNAEIQSKMIEFQLEMNKIIHSYEANVPSDTYANIGLSQFQFDSQN